MVQNKSQAVMARRHEPPDSLDYFPTPPWATRALCVCLEAHFNLSEQSCWEPACGRGHMVRPLREYFSLVHSSDVYAYDTPDQDTLRDFLFYRWDDLPGDLQQVDWIITNPPFRLGEQFALHALEMSHVGVALLVRTQFLETIGRYQKLFDKHEPTHILQFTERVPMVKGRLDPDISTATAYCWVIWVKEWMVAGRGCRFQWIRPVRTELTMPGDYDDG